MISSITFLAKHDPEFINRKRKKDNARETYDNKILNFNMLNHIDTFFPPHIDDDKMDHCRQLLCKDEHYREQRLEKLEHTYKKG